MEFHVTLNGEQFEFLSSILNDVVQLYEHQAAGMALLDGEAARDLAQEQLDASQSAAELVSLLAECEGAVEEVKYPIPQHHLTTATESLKEMALRLEMEAASLAVVNSREGVLKAGERLEQAAEVYKTFEYFLNL